MRDRILLHHTRPVLLTVAVLLALVFVYVFTGCAATPQAEAADPEASQAAAPDTVSPPEPTNDVHAFGETVTWDNNVSLSVSVPAPYTPSDYAAGAVEGHSTVLFEFVLSNNSDENYEPLVYGTATSGGVEAPGVFDTAEGIGFPPTTVLLPGQTIKWLQAYSVLDAANITMQVSAGFTYDDAIFTNTQ